MNKCKITARLSCLFVLFSGFRYRKDSVNTSKNQIFSLKSYLFETL